MRLDKFSLIKLIENILISLFPVSIIIGPAVTEFLILLFLVLLLKEKKNIINFFPNKFLLNIFLSFFLCIFLVNLLNFMLFSFENFSSLQKSFFYLRFIIIVLFISIIFEDKSRVKYFLFPWLLVLIFLIFDAMLQEFSGKDLFGYSKNPNGRLGGPFGTELIVGGVIFKFLIIFNLCIQMINKPDQKKLVLLWLLINLFALTAILLTKERSTILLAIFYLTWVLFFTPFFNGKFKFFTIILFIITTVCIFSINQTLSKKFYDSFLLFKGLNVTKSKTMTSLPGYYAHFYSAIEIFNENKFIGAGLKKYRFSCKKFQNKETEFKKSITNKLDERQLKNFNLNICTTHPHHYLLEILSETGLFSLIIYIVLMVYILKNSIVNFTPVVFTIFIPFVPTGSFFNNFNSFFIWTIFSLLILLIKKNKSNQ